MTPAVQDILADLAQRGIELQAEGGRLRFRPLAAMTADLRAAVSEHKAELLAALAHGSGGLKGFHANDVDQGEEVESVAGRIGDEDVSLHQNNQARIEDVDGLLIRELHPKRGEGLASQQLIEGRSFHAHSIHHDGTALQHADRETVRFLRVAVPMPDGSGFYDPASHAPVAPGAEPVRSASWVPGHTLAGERPGWTPEGWRDRLLYLAMRCENDRPERAVELRQAAEAMLTGQPALPLGVESIGDIVARVVPWAKYFRKPA